MFNCLIWLLTDKLYMLVSLMITRTMWQGEMLYITHDYDLIDYSSAGSHRWEDQAAPLQAGKQWHSGES